MQPSHKKRAQPSPPRRSTQLQKKTTRRLDLAALVPVRVVFQRFLSDHDAARLLRVSRAVATSLLHSFTFQQHVFEPVDVEAMWRLKALCEAYDVRPTRMCVSGKQMKEMQLEQGSGRSPFPSLLSSLLVGSMPSTTDGAMPPRCLFGAEAGRAERIDCPWLHARCEAEDEQQRLMLLEKRSEPVFIFDREWREAADYVLSPGLLPHGLRRLQLDFALDAPLQAGCIPSSVEVLQLGCSTCVPLSVHQLPSSLVHLVLHDAIIHPLAAGVLPVSLQRLYMRSYKHPLAVGVLPASLQSLHMSFFNHFIEPHVLPAGLTHLSLLAFDHPLTVGALPPALVSLDLGEPFQQPILPHVLPSSLRVLFHGRTTRHPLQPGALPEGLVALHWRVYNRQPFNHPLLPGVLPSTLRVLDMGHQWRGDIAAGAVPDGVRWLRLPARMRAGVERRLPAGARVMWI